MVGTVPQIEKLTGDNSKLEKERVMQSFKEGLKNNFQPYFRVKVVLICTDVAGMGIDIQDLNFCVNLGKATLEAGNVKCEIHSKTYNFCSKTTDWC